MAHLTVRLDDAENRYWLHRLRGEAGVAKAQVNLATIEQNRGALKPSFATAGRVRVARPVIRAGQMYLQHYWTRPEADQSARPGAPARIEDAAPARLAPVVRAGEVGRAARALGQDPHALDALLQAWKRSPESSLGWRLQSAAARLFGIDPDGRADPPVDRAARALWTLTQAGQDGRKPAPLWRGVRGDAAKSLLASRTPVSLALETPLTCLSDDREVARQFAGETGCVLRLAPPARAVLAHHRVWKILDDFSEVVVAAVGEVALAPRDIQWPAERATAHAPAPLASPPVVVQRY